MSTEVGAEGIDLSRVQAEINEEVRRRRAAGDFPPGLERELDAIFARYAPAGAGDDFDEVMVQAETQSFIHVDVVTASAKPGVAYVKRALRKVMAWYLRFLAQQVTAFAGAITRAVRLLGERVDALETVTVLASERTLAEVRERRAGPDLSAWSGPVTAELEAGRGRILHTECGAGGLLAALDAAHGDAYGVEPVESLAMAASRAGLDVRSDEALAHLRALPDGTLGALVLSGSIDALPLGEVLETADRAAAVVAAGGTIIVISAGPATWLRTADPVVADLTPGRPLHAETWCHLLAERGFGDTKVLPAPGSAGPAAGPSQLAPADVGLQRVDAGIPGAEVINANIELLSRALFAPSAYAVVARRP
ncbi:MAG: hypothetical protein NVSMB12_18080 [Acidimicrobiales bacterium]